MTKESGKKIRIAINGFGRIGRGIVRSLIESKFDGSRSCFQNYRYLDRIDIVGINSSGLTSEYAQHAILYDSIYGRYNGEITILNDDKGYDNIAIDLGGGERSGDDYLYKCDDAADEKERYELYKKNLDPDGRDADGKDADGKKDMMIRISAEKDIEKIPWHDMDIDVVFECTGAFKDREQIEKYFATSALKDGRKEGRAPRYVMISSPFNAADSTIVLGANTEKIRDESEKDNRIISIGSCTTNCTAPILKIIDEIFGINSAFVNTIHAYTNDQNLVDSRHPDFCRSRAAAMSIIPTSTGVTKAIGAVLPNLAGRIHGAATRVPVANVSMIDSIIQTERDLPDLKMILNNICDKILNSKAEGRIAIDLGRIIGVSDKKLVSIDFNKTTESSILDLTQCMRISNGILRICAWYDNEWAFSHRMLDACIGLLSLS